MGLQLEDPGVHFESKTQVLESSRAAPAAAHSSSADHLSAASGTLCWPGCSWHVLGGLRV